METYRKHFALILCALSACASCVFGAFDGYELTIGNPDGGDGKTAPYFYATMDAAGYSDWIWYGETDLHEQSYHEVLSGEWGAAIYYDGIDRAATLDPNDSPDRKQAMWLTKQFVVPNWPTYSDFRFGGTIKAEHDETNPSPLMNTGRSVILNNEVEIMIDYEVVDLEPLGETYSPMTFIADPNSGAVSYMFSDRYVFLQTYTVKNIKTETLTDLELYQFLHSHGANEYAALVNSTYTDIAISDPLSSYTPVNSVHQVSNFRYDITQWNERPFGNATHVDYAGFSCAVAPDWIDNDVYEGHEGKPNTGTHLHIEDRLLNNADSIYTAEVGGAMGWHLGSLDPNETASLTVAFMFGPKQDSPVLALTKTDSLDPGETVSPGDEVTYTICWENIGTETATDVVLVDYFPAGVTYPEGWDRIGANWELIPADPNYDQANHTYSWQLGDIAAGEEGCVSLRVVVNEQAEPGMTIRNEAVLGTSLGDAGGQWDTNVECWDTGGIIYVDARATGYNTGTSWQHGYTDLQRALLRAAAGCGSEIWVARGTYDPGRLPTDRFNIPDNISVDGGFKGDETSRDQRDPARYKTILTGGADPQLNDTVVTMGDNCILDGFIVTQSAEYGVYGKDVDFAVENCSITQGSKQGLYAENGNIIVRWCSVTDNEEYGIHHIGQGYTVIIENSSVVENKQYGIYSKDSTPTIKNSVISGNGFGGEDFFGINILLPTDTPVLYNNTLAYNANAGIAWVDDFGSGVDPNLLDYPDIQNCILWYNNDGGEQLAGYTFTQYSCVFDPNNPEGTTTPDANGNITCPPGFAYEYSTDPNVLLNVHLAYDSPCIDKGSPVLSYADQLDIDSEDRVVGTYVDIGADEVYSCDDDLTEDDIYHEVDWTADGIVNFHEYGIFVASWLSADPNNPLCDPNNPGYISDPNDPGFISEGDKLRFKAKCDLDVDLDVDLADLALFCNEWLWMACWKQSQMDSSIMMMGMGAGAQSASVMTREPIVVETAAATPWTPEWFLAKGHSEQVSIVIAIYAVLDYVDARIQDKAPNTEALYELQTFLLECLEDITATREHQSMLNVP